MYDNNLKSVGIYLGRIIQGGIKKLGAIGLTGLLLVTPGNAIGAESIEHKIVIDPVTQRRLAETELIKRDEARKYFEHLLKCDKFVLGESKPEEFVIKDGECYLRYQVPNQ